MIIIITIAGVIGAGKTSLGQQLEKHLGTKLYEEPVADNPILPLFYEGNKRVEEGTWKTNPYTFELQIYFLNKRFNMIKQAMQQDNNILDRSIYEDEIFMRMNVDQGHASQEEWKVYKSLLNNMMEEYPHFSPAKKAPDLMVLIRVNYDTMIERIKKRGREFEQIDQDPSLVNYYHDLIRYYDQWQKEYDASPLLTINGNRYDFMASDDDRKSVLQDVDDALLAVGSIDQNQHKKLIGKLEQAND